MSNASQTGSPAAPTPAASPVIPAPATIIHSAGATTVNQHYSAAPQASMVATTTVQDPVRIQAGVQGLGLGHPTLPLPAPITSAPVASNPVASTSKGKGRAPSSPRPV